MRLSTTLGERRRDYGSQGMCGHLVVDQSPSSLLNISLALHHTTWHSDGQSIYVVPTRRNTHTGTHRYTIHTDCNVFYSNTWLPDVLKCHNYIVNQQLLQYSSVTMYATVHLPDEHPMESTL